MSPFLRRPVAMTLQAEGAALGILCTYLYAQTGTGWGMFAVLLLVPDLLMLGYLAGPRWGALCYNMSHSTVLPIALAGTGWATQAPMMLGVALIWGAHIGFDRAIGYGLKYASGFRATHLGRV